MDIFRKGLRKLVRKVAGRGLLTPKATVIMHYMIETGRIPNLRKPEDLNEKLIRMAFHGDTSRWSILADKFKVRQFVSDSGYPDILIPLYGVFNSAEEIDFGKMPDKFVIKSTNGSGQTIIVENKRETDFRNVVKQVESWQTKPFGNETGETHYLKIEPKILIEEKIAERLPVDYKFMCFNGKVHSCLVCSDRDENTFTSKRNLMNVKTWEEIKESVRPSLRGDAPKLNKPEGLTRMVEIASRLSSGFSFVRIDLYEVEGKIFFGEMTFSPSGFHITSIKRRILKEMGEMVKNI